MTVRGIVVCLPDAPMDDYIGVIEVLIQEGFSHFALPANAEALADVIAIFGARATFGALRVWSSQHVHRAADAGARFLFSDVAGSDVADASDERGLPCWGSAMTPREVRGAVQLTGGALLYPADVVGHAMAARLAELDLVGQVIPLGGVGAYAAGEWLKAGSPAVGVDHTLLGDAFDGGPLGQLRDRCHSFISLERRYVTSAEEQPAD
ncbi:hypothetical protein [Tessaracoccus massiliensis]|uniref:hypothetical protein n=1 Tax=Tessaracoccus massiliensis TaxID=1522311 RepID=UPI0009E2E2F5|nr:hypothetical protein [Tessaracoccus massiliensis]